MQARTRTILQWTTFGAALVAVVVLGLNGNLSYPVVALLALALGGALLSFTRPE